MPKDTELFEDIINEAQNHLVEQAVEDGRIPVGYTCSYVPLPILSTCGMFPLRLRAPGVESTELSDVYLSSVVCSYTRSMLEFYMQGTFDFIRGYVIPESCDHMRRFNDHLDYFKRGEDDFFNYCLDVPRKDQDISIEYFYNELLELARRLGEYFNVDITDEAVAEQIEKHNEFNALLKSIAELRKADNPVITGAEFHKLMLATLSAPRDLLVDEVKNFKDALAARKPVPDYRARILVLGSSLDNPEYISAIESQGALVVADRFCTGALPYALDPIPEGGDPFQALTEYYLKKCTCPRMMENFNLRFAQVMDLIDEYRVDGVIYEAIKFCDIWGVDAIPMIDTLREAGVPVLRLEREYRHTGEGQLITRTQAFLESIEGRRKSA